MLLVKDSFYISNTIYFTRKQFLIKQALKTKIFSKKILKIVEVTY